MKNWHISKDTAEWLHAAGIRALKTFAQTAVSLITVGNLVTDIDWVGILSISLTSAICSILTSIAGLPEVSHVPALDNSGDSDSDK